MTSLAFTPRTECGNPEFAQDPRLFDLKTQLDFRRDAIADTFGLEKEQVEYNPGQDLLATGWKSVEMYFSTTGKVHSTEAKMRGGIAEKIKKARAEGNERLANRLEAQEFFFVPIEHLKPMLENQGELSRLDATTYRPDDPRKMPLIDESLVGLLGGYTKLTGEELDPREIIEKLNRTGLNINVMNMSGSTEYRFPTRI